MAKKIVTLYVDDASIQLLVTRSNRVKKWANWSLQPDLVKGGVIIEEAKENAMKQYMLMNLIKVENIRR